MKQKKSFKQAMRLFITMSLIFVACIVATRAQTDIFTYQGRLTDTNNPSGSGTYQMQFAVYDSPIGGDLLGTVTINNVPVTNGVFTVQLDANAFMNFSGSGVRYLEVRVFNAATNQYVTLAPRQQITSAPFAIKAQTAAIADVSLNTQAVGGIAAANIIKEGDARLSDARTPAAGSSNYIQNGSAAQTASFNISGNGIIGGNGIISGVLSGNSVNTATNFTFNSVPILKPGTDSIFVGINSGFSTTGDRNSFLGNGSGYANVGGRNNSFFGFEAGNTNRTGSNNTIIGADADVDSEGLMFATAIGSGAIVRDSNSVVLGRNIDTVRIPGSLNLAGSLNLNIVNAATQYNLAGSRFLSAAGAGNTFVGIDAGRDNTSGQQNAFFGNSTGLKNSTGAGNSFFGFRTGVNNTSGINNVFVGKDTGYRNSTGNDNVFLGVNAGFESQTGTGNSFFGWEAGYSNLSGSYNTAFGASADFGADNLNYATVIGSGATSSRSNSITLGRANGIDTLVVPGNFELGLDLRVGANARVIGRLLVHSLAGGGEAQLCRRADSFELAFCSSSLRYKTNLAPFSEGLSFVRQLQPISYDWKTGGRRDVGFGAEDVAKINPLFVTYNPQGEVEGVKYDRLSVAFVNAFKEQQTQIETQSRQIEQQQKQINELRSIVCALKPDAEVCREEK